MCLRLPVNPYLLAKLRTAKRVRQLPTREAEEGHKEEGEPGKGGWCGATTNFKDLNVVPSKSNRIESNRIELKPKQQQPK